MSESLAIRHYHGPGGMKELLRIAAPMIVSAGADTLMMFTDRYFVSELGKEHLAATMSGSLASYLLMTFFLGVMAQTTGFVGQYFGSNQRSRCSLVVTQSFLFSLAGYPLLFLVAAPLIRKAFVACGHSSTLVDLEYRYFLLLGLAALISLLRSAFASFYSGIGRTRIVMISMLVAVVTNVPLSYIMVFGKFGCPALGLDGAAYATVLSGFLPLLILGCAYFSKANREAFNIKESIRLDPALLRRMLRFGSPSGLENLLKILGFTGFVLLMQSYNADVAAAVTIAFNWNLVSFLPLIGIQVGTTALVGQYMGAGDIARAERATYSGLKLAVTYSAVIIVIYLSLTLPLIRVFTPNNPDVDYGVVTSLAATMIRMSCAYVLFDAAFIVFSGALKGAGDTVWPMTLNATVYLLLALISGIMIKVTLNGPIQVWSVFIVFNLILGTALALRFRGARWKQIKMIH